MFGHLIFCFLCHQFTALTHNFRDSNDMRVCCSYPLYYTMDRLVMILSSLAMLMVLSCCPGAEASHAVPVMVSTVSRSAIFVYDISADGNGNVLCVSWYNNAVYRLASDGGSLLLAGSGNNTFGATDGVGTAATFYNPYGITCDTTNNIAYISDTYNYRIRTLALANHTVTTLAGSTPGHADGVGSAAQFFTPYGIVYHSSGVLYVAESDNSGYIRRIAVASANVTSTTPIAAYNHGNYLCINNAGTLLYVTTPTVVLQVNISTGVSVVKAGSLDSYSYADGIGADARFYNPQGIALNNDESALIIADQHNQRIRRLEIATNNVTTIAGNVVGGYSDGPGVTATFSSPYGVKWSCNATMSVCGVLVADYGYNAVRFVAIEAMSTTTAALSDEGSVTSSVSHDASSTSYSSTLATSRTRSSGSHSSVVGPSATNIVSMTSSTSLSRSGTTQSTATLSRRLSVTSTTSKSISSSSSITMNASWSRSATAGAAASHTMGATLSLATVGATASITPTTLTSHSKTASVSNTRTKASRSHSGTQRSVSPSASTHCALVAADGAASLGSLNPFDAGTIINDELPAGTVLDTSAASLSRAALLRSSPLGANVSLSLGGTIRGGPVDGWGLVSATVDVLPAGSLLFPLLTAVVPSTLLSTVVVGRTQSLVVLLGPPNATSPPRWLPTSLSTFRDVTLVLHLLLRCPTDRSMIATVSVSVACPGEVQALASEVKTAGSVAQYSTSFAGPASGGAVGRLASVRSLVLCSGDAVVAGLLPLVVDACGATAGGTTVIASVARGGIVGNLALWAGVCTLMALAVAVYAHLCDTTLRAAAEALGVPSPLLPLVVVTVPSTVSSTFYLLHSPGCGWDGVVAALGVVMCVGPIAALCLVAYVVPRRLVVVRLDDRLGRRVPRSFAASLWSSLLDRRVKWCGMDADSDVMQIASYRRTIDMDPAPSHDASYAWLRAATVVLLDYATVWYACVDVAVLTASCVLGALGMLGSAEVCRAGATTILVLYVGQVAVCAAVRPFTTLFSHVYALFTLALSVIAVMCQVWYLFGSTADNADLDALSTLLTVAAVCDLLVSGVSMLKMLLDAVDAGRACLRHVNAVRVALFGPRAHSLVVTTAAHAFVADAHGHTRCVIEDVELLTEAAPLPIVNDSFDVLSITEDCFNDGVRDGSGGIFTAGENTVQGGMSDLVRMYGEA